MRKPSVYFICLVYWDSRIEIIQWHAQLFCQFASCSEPLFCVWKSNIFIGRSEYTNSMPISSKCLTKILSNSAIPLQTHQVPLHGYWMTWLLGMTKDWIDFWLQDVCVPLSNLADLISVSKAKLDACPLPRFVSQTSQRTFENMCTECKSFYS